MKSGSFRRSGSSLTDVYKRQSPQRPRPRCCQPSPSTSWSRSTSAPWSLSLIHIFRKDLKAQERAARLEALQTLPSLERARKLYEGREVTDYDLANLWPRKDVDEFLHERGLDYYQIQRKLKGEGDGVTFRLLEIHDEQEREAWLERTMEEEKRAKLLDLIGRIMSTVGTITDATALRIGPEGDINGYIEGTEGKAKIQTIGAGGYNIQCFHFRTLIHE